MVVTDLVVYEKRADYMGKLGLWYGVGMVIGPSLGGVITKNLRLQSLYDLNIIPAAIIIIFLSFLSSPLMLLSAALPCMDVC